MKQIEKTEQIIQEVETVNNSGKLSNQKQYKFYITFDETISNINEFNIILLALKQHNIPYNIFISTRAPYNWYINMDYEPLTRFYTLASKPQQRWLVSVITPLNPSESNKLKRRNFDNSLDTIKQFIINDVFNDVINNYAVVFKYSSNQELLNLSKNIKDTKIYILGTYKRNIKLALCTNMYALSYISNDKIIVQKKENEMNKPGEFEAYINYVGLLNRTKILKYFETEYFINGTKVLPANAGKRQ